MGHITTTGKRDRVWLKLYEAPDWWWKKISNQYKGISKFKGCSLQSEEELSIMLRIFGILVVTIGLQLVVLYPKKLKNKREMITTRRSTWTIIMTVMVMLTHLLVPRDDLKQRLLEDNG